jgi:DNA-binding response OmpR family regulator
MMARAQFCLSSRPDPESKIRVLYVGRDLGLVSALRRYRKETKFGIVYCPDRESAILFLKSEIPYQLLLIDLEWRGKEGFKLARLAHSLRHRKQMSSILVAATQLTRQMEVVARKAGIEECVMKTEDMGEVTEAIRRVVGEE